MDLYHALCFSEGPVPLPRDQILKKELAETAVVSPGVSTQSSPGSSDAQSTFILRSSPAAPMLEL